MKESFRDFQDEKVFDGGAVRIGNIREIGMGGPLIGDLFVNGAKVKGIYGGPFDAFRDTLYIPILRRSLFSSEGRFFDLAAIPLRVGVSARKLKGLHCQALGVSAAESSGVSLILRGGTATIPLVDEW